MKEDKIKNMRGKYEGLRQGRNGSNLGKERWAETNPKRGHFCLSIPPSISSMKGVSPWSRPKPVNSIVSVKLKEIIAITVNFRLEIDIIHLTC